MPYHLPDVLIICHSYSLAYRVNLSWHMCKGYTLPRAVVPLLPADAPMKSIPSTYCIQTFNTSLTANIDSFPKSTIMLILVLDTVFSARYEMKFYDCQGSYIYDSHYIANYFHQHLDICELVPHYCFQFSPVYFVRACVLGKKRFSAIRAGQRDWQHFFFTNWFCIHRTCWCVFYQKVEWAKLENLLQNWRSFSNQIGVLLVTTFLFRL
jgi:hypothetical protein